MSTSRLPTPSARQRGFAELVACALCGGYPQDPPCRDCDGSGMVWASTELLQREAGIVTYSGPDALVGPPGDWRQVEEGYMASAAAAYLACRHIFQKPGTTVTGTREPGSPERVQLTATTGERLTLTGLNWGMRTGGKFLPAVTSQRTEVLTAVLWGLGAFDRLDDGEPWIGKLAEAHWVFVAP